VTRSQSYLIEQDHIHLIRLEQRTKLFFRRRALVATRPSNISPERVSPMAFVVGQPCPGENSESSDRPLPERRLFSDNFRSSLLPSVRSHIPHTIRNALRQFGLIQPSPLGWSWSWSWSWSLYRMSLDVL
jgi:hypothetical protein